MTPSSPAYESWRVLRIPATSSRDDIDCILRANGLIDEDNKTVCEIIIKATPGDDHVEVWFPAE